MMIVSCAAQEGEQCAAHSHETNRSPTFFEGCPAFFWLLPKGESAKLTVRCRRSASSSRRISSIAPWRWSRPSTSMIFNPPRQDWLNGTDAYLRGWPRIDASCQRSAIQIAAIFARHSCASAARIFDSQKLGGTIRCPCREASYNLFWLASAMLEHGTERVPAVESSRLQRR